MGTGNGQMDANIFTETCFEPTAGRGDVDSVFTSSMLGAHTQSKWMDVESMH